jgi:hypothetical protein
MSFQRSFLIACVAALGAASGWQAALASAQGRSAGDQAVPRPHPPYGIVAFDLNDPVPSVVRSLGVGVVRGSCSWAELEPARRVFDWGCADNVITGAQALNLMSYMTVLCTPAWANGASGCQTMPADMGDWYDFVLEFVTRYAGFDTVLGVWNEPNLALNDTPSGQNYALLFLNASNARNAVKRSFRLAGPETSHHAAVSGYFQATLDLIQTYGALNPADIIAVHWYPDGPPLVDYLDAVHGVADRQEVWLSETGMSTADPQSQAAFFDRVLGTFLHSDRPWWTHLIFYRLWDGEECCSEAIVTRDYSPKPAFDVYRRWIAAPIAVPRSWLP